MAGTTYGQWRNHGSHQSPLTIKQRVPMLRRSWWRLVWGSPGLTKTGQIGDGREAAAAEYVLSHTNRGDVDAVLAALDTFALEKSFLVSVGAEKGRLLDAAVRRADPLIALELGAYCGYGALRIARAAPAARVYSVDLAEANAQIARRIWDHAGVADRVTCVVGTFSDGGRTADTLASKHGFTSECVDFLFIDHDKSFYVHDLKLIAERGWLRQGSIVVADNVLFPGAPKYRRYMREHQGNQWDTRVHKTYLENQRLIPDLVLESEYLGAE